MAFLLDTGFLFAFIDDTDAHHQSVSSIFGSIRDPIYLPIPAITEVAYFVSKYLGPRFLEQFLDGLSKSDFILEAPTSSDYSRAAAIIRKYNDANLDFVDVCIFAMAERLKITKILTIDRRHFQIFRPKHCTAFEILP
jgi:uncharacterized protein